MPLGIVGVELLAGFIFGIEISEMKRQHCCRCSEPCLASKLNTGAVKSILDRVTIGTAGRADSHDLMVAEANRKNTSASSWKTAVQRLDHLQTHHLHVTDWVAAQQEYPILKIVMEWISSHKVQDLKYLLGDHTTTEEGMAILRERKKFTLHQACPLSPPYSCWQAAGGSSAVCSPHGSYSSGHEQVPLRDVGHLGPNSEHYPCCKTSFCGLAWQCRCQKVISGCEKCIQHEGARVKAPLKSILVTSPLELLHVDFTGIEMTTGTRLTPNM